MDSRERALLAVIRVRQTTPTCQSRSSSSNDGIAHRLRATLASARAACRARVRSPRQSPSTHDGRMPIVGCGPGLLRQLTRHRRFGHLERHALPRRNDFGPILTGFHSSVANASVSQTTGVLANVGICSGRARGRAAAWWALRSRSRSVRRGLTGLRTRSSVTLCLQ